MPWRLLALFLAAMLQPACLQIPDYNETGCGDSILGVGEDCDGRYARGDGECAAPGSEHACHYVCTGATCPAGWGCGVDGRCYQPQAVLEAPEGAEPVPIQVTDVVDVDGDGFGDLLGTSGITLSTRFSDGAGAFDSVFNLVIPPRSGQIWVAPLDDDAQSDAIIPLGPSLLVLSGQETRDFASRLFPTEVLPIQMQEAAGVALEADRDSADPDAELLVLRQVEQSGSTASVMEFRDSRCGEPNGVFLPGGQQVSNLGSKSGVTAFAGATRIPRADLDGDGFTELALAFGGSRTLYLYGSTGSASSTDPATCLRPAPYTGTPTIAPPDGFMLSAHDALFADIDGDTDLDVLMGVALATEPAPDEILTEGIAVAKALGDGTYEAQATPLPGLGRLPPELMESFALLAAGDLDGDGTAEYVTSIGILRVAPPVEPEKSPRLVPLASPDNALWTTAEVLDLNGDGALDVVTAGPERFDWFLNATPTGLKGQLNQFTLDAPPGEPQLRSGDFNGDLQPDIVLVARIDPMRNELALVLGSPAGVPGQVQSIGGFGGRLHFVETGFLPELGGVSIDGLTDLLLWTTSDPLEPDQPSDVAFYALQGSTSQRLLSPFFVAGEPAAANGRATVLVAAAGNFVESLLDEPGAPIVQRSVAVVSQSSGTDSLAASGFTMLISTRPGELRPATPEPLALPAPSRFQTTCARWLVGDVVPEDFNARDELIGIEHRCDESDSEQTPAIMVIRADAPDQLVEPDIIDLPAEYVDVSVARLADLDHDGWPDLVLILAREDLTQPADVMVLWNDGSCAAGRFCSSSSTLLQDEAGRAPRDVVAMQLAGDERRELVVLYAPLDGLMVEDVLVVFAADQNAPRSYAPGEMTFFLPGNRFATYLAAGDVNGDGLDDLVLGGELASVAVQVPAEPVGTTEAKQGVEEEIP